MGLCMKTPFGGTLVITNCLQSWIDANIRVKPEAGSGLVQATPGTQDIDGIYWGGPYAREVWKVPDNCRVEITCDGEGGITIHTCHNLVTWLAGYRLQTFAPGAALPDSSWPQNNW